MLCRNKGTYQWSDPRAAICDVSSTHEERLGKDNHQLSEGVIENQRKITVENCDLVHQFEEAERTAATLSKDRSSLTTQLEDAKRLADAETRERINLLGKMR